MKLTEEQIHDYAKAKELRIDLPPRLLTDKQLARRYHLFRGDASDGEEKAELFYNNDLRSLCGLDGEAWDDGQGGNLIIFPGYYAEGWEDSYFGRLLRDALQIKVTEK